MAEAAKNASSASASRRCAIGHRLKRKHRLCAIDAQDCFFHR
jgi:hypothetical protein